MKKFFAIVMALALVVCCFAACGGNNGGETETTTEATEPTEPVTENVADTEKGEGVMTYADYMAAAADTEVVVEAYVQGVAYSAEYGNASLYLADADGAYYVYRMTVTEEQAADLVVGTKLKVTGVKGEWSGEVEITDATFEIEEGYYVAEAKDITELLAAEELVDDMNKAVVAKGLTVAAKGQDEEGNDLAFFYSHDNSGEDGADLYFDVVLGENTYTLTVETDECAADSDVYAAVKALKVGDVIDVEGFLYWYEGAQIHVNAVAAAKADDEVATEEATEEVTEEATEEVTEEATEEATEETTEAAE